MTPAAKLSNTKTKGKQPELEETDEENFYDSEDNADAPRISQWVDEDDLDEDPPPNDFPEAGPSKLVGEYSCSLLRANFPHSGFAQGRLVCLLSHATCPMFILT